MRRTLPAVAAAIVCTANTGTAVFAQALDVAGLDGKSVTMSLGALERRTVVTQDGGLRTEFQ